MVHFLGRKGRAFGDVTTHATWGKSPGVYGFKIVRRASGVRSRLYVDVWRGGRRHTPLPQPPPPPLTQTAADAGMHPRLPIVILWAVAVSTSSIVEPLDHCDAVTRWPAGSRLYASLHCFCFDVRAIVICCTSHCVSHGMFGTYGIFEHAHWRRQCVF